MLDLVNRTLGQNLLWSKILPGMNVFMNIASVIGELFLPTVIFKLTI